MSDKESKFVDTNPENQKPHNISGKNPRSVQTLHKSQVKPRSQDKEINIEIVENEDTVYKTKTTYLVQKAKMQLKRRVAPGVSEIIIRKNEEKRKLAEAKAEEEAKARAEAEKAEKEELETKVQKEIEKQDEKIAQRKGINEEKEEVSEEPAEEKVEKTEDATSTQSNATGDGKSFTQTLREQGLIYGQKIVDAVEKAKPGIEATINEAKTIVAEEAEKAKAQPSSEGKSFTQTLREQGFIEGQKIIEAVEKSKPEIEATIEEAKNKVEQIVEEVSKPKETPKAETTTDGKSFTQTLREQGFIQTETTTTEAPKAEKVEVKEEKVEEVSKPKETPKAETTTDGKSFTQTLREQGFIQTETTTTEAPEAEKVEVKEEKVEEKVEDTKKEDKPSDDGEVKTFIDLIRSEGLL